MSLSQLLSRAISTINSISSNAVFILIIPIIFFTFFPLTTNFFFPSDDYAIYEYFAEAVSQGINPYSIPADFKSEIVPKILKVGDTQPSPGVIRQEYADYPPLLMVINSFAFRFHNVKGLYVMYLLLYALALIFLLMYLESKHVKKYSPEINPLALLVFFGLSPIFSQGWFCPITDKVWFAFFILLLLVVHDKPQWLVVVLGFFAAIKGIGLLIMAFYILYQFFNKEVQRKQLLYGILVFSSILILSHLFWFPDWMKGYQWRSARQSFVNHFSLFLPFSKMGLYWSGIPFLCTIGSCLLLVWLIIKRRVQLDEVLLLPIAISIIFNTEIGYDRILVAVFALVLLARKNIVVIISYILGIYIVTFADRYAWPIIWGWITFLLWSIGTHMIERISQQGALRAESTNV